MADSITPTHGLVPVYDVQERSGLIFVTQDKPLSDGALADLPDLLGEEQTVFNTITFVDNANWKLIGETSMEGYHIRALHNKSFYHYGYDNLNVVGLFGRNSRIVFPFRKVEKLRDRPREEWSLQGCVTDVIQLFPNVHTSTLTNHVMLIILEPVSVNETRWIIYQMRRCHIRRRQSPPRRPRRRQVHPRCSTVRCQHPLHLRPLRGSNRPLS